jgi:two-component system NarL family sensor kinase
LYAVILGVYAVAAVLWLVAALKGPVSRWGDGVSTAFDLTVIITLCLVSGGATAALLPIFFLLPISVAFQDRPALTAVIGTVTAVGYLAVWIFYSKRDDKVGLPNMVYTHFGFLLWLAGRGDRAVFRARAAIRAGESAKGDAAPAGLAGDAVRRASQPRSRRAPA